MSAGCVEEMNTEVQNPDRANYSLSCARYNSLTAHLYRLFCVALLVLTIAVGAASRMIEQQGRAGSTAVSAAFRPEITRLAAEGLQLRESLEASLDGNSRHLAGIFESKKP